MENIIVGCGLSGCVIARYLADKGEKVTILERRNHIGGNMYDFRINGILAQKYGPHTFHTNKKELFEYMCNYSEWEEYKLTCGAVIDNQYTPTPFNFTTLDDFFNPNEVEQIKNSIYNAYGEKEYATVLEMMNHEDENIRMFANFLFEKDYSLYTAKQWGVSPSDIDPSVLKRVPIRFSYDVGYFDDKYQVMPKKSFLEFFNNILSSENITVKLNCDANQKINFDEYTENVLLDGEKFEGRIIYTGAIDELMKYKYGKLPYRSLKFEWKEENIVSFQQAPVVAYPQAEGYTRITEYTKIPVQKGYDKTIIAIEYPLKYEENNENEPYYPVITKESKELYEKYSNEMKKYKNVYLCGRLANFKYYNMDQALENALELCKKI